MLRNRRLQDDGITPGNQIKDDLAQPTRQEKLFQDAPVWKAIASMAIPSIVTMLVMIFYNMADMFFVGRTGDTVQVAAVSLVGPVFTVMMAIGSMLSGGACVLIAKTLGQKDIETVKLYSSLCCWGGVVFGIVFGLIALIAREPLLGFLGAEGEIQGYARTYLTILALGAPVMIFTTAAGGMVRAEGAIKEGMFGNILSTASNIILDPIFILVLGMGVGGAAVATVLANVAGAVYYILYLRFSNTNNTLNPVYALRKPLAIGKIIAIGLPNAMSSILVGFASAIANRLLVRYGTNAVAAMAAAGKATMVISMIQMGITMGVQPLLAYNYGARNIRRMREAIFKLSILTVTIGLSVTLLCVFNGKAVVAIFLKDGAALALGQEMIHLLVLSGPVLGLYYLSSTFLQASGNAPLASLVSLLRQGIFLVPLLYLMNYLFEVKGNVLAHVVADYSAAALAIVLAVYQYRKLMKSVPAADGFSHGESGAARDTAVPKPQKTEGGAQHEAVG